MVLGSSVRSPFAFATPPDISSPPEITMSDSSPPRGLGASTTFLSSSGLHASSTLNSSTSGFNNSTNDALALQRTTTPPVGTPIRLAPSASAYRKPGSGGPVPQKTGGGMVGALNVQPGGVQPSPSKGVLGQVSDLIFGW